MAPHVRKSPNENGRIKKKLEKPTKDIKPRPKKRQDKLKELLQKKSYSPTEAADLLGISMSTIRRMLKSGSIKSFRTGRLFHISSDEIDRVGRGETTINLQEAAKLLGISDLNIVRRFLRDGQVASYRFSAHSPWRIPLESIERLMRGET